MDYINIKYANKGIGIIIPLALFLFAFTKIASANEGTVSYRFSPPVNHVSVSSHSEGTSYKSDKQFIEDIVPYHEDAIQMSRYMITHSSLVHIRDIAQSILSSSLYDTKTLRTAYAQLSGRQFPPYDLTMDSGKMEFFGYSTHPEDRFLSQMIMNHQTRLERMKMMEPDLSSDDMKRLTQEMIEVDTKHLDRMKTIMDSGLLSRG